jgi:lipoyl(octanoyl) transferase
MFLQLFLTCVIFTIPILLFAFQFDIPIGRHRHHVYGKLHHQLMAFQQQLGIYEELTFEEDRKSRRVVYYDFTSSTSLLSSDDMPITTSESTSSNSNTKNIHLQQGTPMEYYTAWDIQKQFLQSHLDRMSLSMQTNGSTNDNKSKMMSSEQDEISSSSFLPIDHTNMNLIGIDTILFVEHEPVYTLGTGSDASFILKSSLANSPPVVRMDRGGEVTYHGPGQLTVYPILDLRNYNQDIHWYVRALEEVIIRALNAVISEYTDPSDQSSTSKLIAKREDNITGVWIDEHKVAAIGVKCKKWITQHGFAINVTPESMKYIDQIVPCGLVGRKVGYVNQFITTTPISVSQMTQFVMKALEDVFQIQLVRKE